MRADDGSPEGPGTVESLVTAPEGGAPPVRRDAVEIRPDGVEGDRYRRGDGHFRLDACAVTLVAAAALGVPPVRNARSTAHSSVQRATVAARAASHGPSQRRSEAAGGSGPPSAVSDADPGRVFMCSLRAER